MENHVSRMNMTKNYFDYARTLEHQQKAMNEAKQRLKSRGIHYPLYDLSLSPDENYQYVLTYSEIEANEIIKILREPDGASRPLAKDNVEPKKEWGNSYYD